MDRLNGEAHVRHGGRALQPACLRGLWRRGTVVTVRALVLATALCTASLVACATIACKPVPALRLRPRVAQWPDLWPDALAYDLTNRRN